MTNKEAIINLKMIGVGFVNVNTKEQIKLICDTFDRSTQALELNDLKAIRRNCNNRSSCKGCMFFNLDTLRCRLVGTPNQWELEE